MQCLLCLFFFYIIFSSIILINHIANEYRAFRAHLHFSWLVCVRARFQFFFLLKLWMRFDCTAATLLLYSLETKARFRFIHIYIFLHCNFKVFRVLLRVRKTFMKLLMNTNTQLPTEQHHHTGSEMEYPNDKHYEWRIQLWLKAYTSCLNFIFNAPQMVTAFHVDICCIHIFFYF